MNPEELTQVVTAHQSAIVRGESRLDRIEATLERIAVGQEANRQAIAQLIVDQQTTKQNIDQLTAEQRLSRQDINQLTASLLELRNIVSDYIQSRAQTE